MRGIGIHARARFQDIATHRCTTSYTSTSHAPFTTILTRHRTRHMDTMRYRHSGPVFVPVSGCPTLRGSHPGKLGRPTWGRGVPRVPRCIGPGPEPGPVQGVFVHRPGRAIDGKHGAGARWERRDASNGGTGWCGRAGYQLHWRGRHGGGTSGPNIRQGDIRCTSRPDLCTGPALSPRRIHEHDQEHSPQTLCPGLAPLAFLCSRYTNGHYATDGSTASGFRTLVEGRLVGERKGGTGAAGSGGCEAAAATAAVLSAQPNSRRSRGDHVEDRQQGDEDSLQALLASPRRASRGQHFGGYFPIGGYAMDIGDECIKKELHRAELDYHGQSCSGAARHGGFVGTYGAGPGNAQHRQQHCGHDFRSSVCARASSGSSVDAQIGIDGPGHQAARAAWHRSRSGHRRPRTCRSDPGHEDPECDHPHRGGSGDDAPPPERPT